MVKMSFSLLGVYLALDGLWLGLIARSFYRERMGHLMREDFSLPCALLVYLLSVSGLMVFVRPKAVTVGRGAFYGALFGLIGYGIYDLTNQAALRDWSWVLSFVDVTWGTFVCAVLGAMMGYMRRKEA